MYTMLRFGRWLFCKGFAAAVEAFITALVFRSKRSRSLLPRGLLLPCAACQRALEARRHPTDCRTDLRPGVRLWIDRYNQSVTSCAQRQGEGCKAGLSDADTINKG